MRSSLQRARIKPKSERVVFMAFRLSFFCAALTVCPSSERAVHDAFWSGVPCVTKDLYCTGGIGTGSPRSSMARVALSAVP